MRAEDEVKRALDTALGGVERFAVDEPLDRDVWGGALYSSTRRQWFRFLVGASSAVSRKSGQRGLPTVIQKLAGPPEVLILNDAQRLDMVIQSAQASGRYPSGDIVRLFIASFQSAIDAAEDSSVTLSPSLVYITPTDIQFAGVGHTGPQHPGPLAWVAALITLGTDFLASKTPWRLSEGHVGRLPEEWMAPDVWRLPHIRQIDIIEAWLRRLGPGSDGAKSSTSRFVDAVFDSRSTSRSEWSARASLAVVVPAPSQLSDRPLEDILRLVQSWSPDTIDWAYRNMRYPMPDVTWLHEVFQVHGARPDVDVLERVLPAVCYSTGHSLDRGDSPALLDLCRMLAASTSLSSSLRRWFGSPRYPDVASLSPRERLVVLPVAVLIAPESHTMRTFNLSLTMLVEADQRLKSGPRDACVWRLLRSLIRTLNPPWGEGQVPPETVRLLEDLHNSVRSRPPDNIHRIETLSSLIVYNDWATHPDVIHATGEILGILRRSYDTALSGEDSPMLDLADIIVTHVTSETDDRWRNKVGDWLRRYPNHPLAEMVRQLALL